MAGGGGGHVQHALLITPVGAVATTCFIFVFFGSFGEYLLHRFSAFLKGNNKNALYEAIEKLKSVLMELGFMSLVLTVTEDPISKICISHAAAHDDNMRACKSLESPSSDYCTSKGKTSFISIAAMHELHMFIFVLAAMKIVYSLTQMGLGMLKMKRWASWEKETSTADPERITGSIASDSPYLLIRCFFRQFFQSLTKDHYLSLRQSSTDSFNFRRHIQQALEDDFKAVIGINPVLLVVAVIFFFGNLLGRHVFVWIWFPFLPLLAVLFVGTKLELIVARMTRDSSSFSDLFWFRRPRLILSLLHFILFMNTFDISISIWVLWQYGFPNCMLDVYPVALFIRIMIALIVQVFCSYNTLPFYALVTQMGSRYKGTMVEEPLHHSGDIPMPVDADASTSHQPPTEFSGEDDEIVECEGTTEAPMSDQPLPTAGEMASEEAGHHVDVVPVDLPAPAGWSKKFTPKKGSIPQRNDVVFVSPTGEEIKSDTPRRCARLSEKSKEVAATPTSQSPKKEQKRSATKAAVEKSNADAEEEEDATAEEEDLIAGSDDAQKKPDTEESPAGVADPNNASTVVQGPKADKSKKALNFIVVF